MEFQFSGRRILSSLKRLRRKWLFFAVAALILAPLLRFLFVTEKGVCSATVTFSYNGVELGLDPDGNRFDETDIKSEALIRKAAEAIGQGLTDEETEQIRGALKIQGNIPGDAFERALKNASIYGEDEISEVTEIGEAEYFPSQYSVAFHYKDVGFSAKRGAQFLEELLKGYERSFYEEYGYNASAGRVLSDVDYESYDYVDAAEILQDRLSLLRSYMATLENRDTTRFVSEETGYSFSDLVSAIDTIQDEDVQWLNSYIVSNNLTKDKDTLIDYYRYKIEDCERALTQQDARMFTLNELIANYVKTNAIFPSVGSAEETSVLSAYEFSQPSAMYDSLINQKVACQTSLSEIAEQIAFFERRIERLQNGESSGDPALVETRLAAVQTKIDRLLQDIRLTAEEFFLTVELRRAVYTQIDPFSPLYALVCMVKNAAVEIVIAEAALFSLYVIFALETTAGRTGKRKKKAGEYGAAQ